MDLVCTCTLLLVLLGHAVCITQQPPLLANCKLRPSPSAAAGNHEQHPGLPPQRHVSADCPVQPESVRLRSLTLLRRAWRGELGASFAIGCAYCLPLHCCLCRQPASPGAAAHHSPTNTPLKSVICIRSCRIPARGSPTIQPLPFPVLQLAPLSSLKGLAQVNLNCCLLDDLPPAVAALPALRTLLLCGNKLADLPQGGSYLICLENLDLSFSMIK